MPSDVGLSRVALHFVMPCLPLSHSLKLALLGCLSLFIAGPAAASLTLHRTASSPHDLALVGGLAGVPTNETRWVRWDDIRRLSTRELTLEGEFLPGEQKVTVVFLETLLDNLPLAPRIDTVIADCNDDYWSIFDRDFIARWKPVVILEINGQGPAHWPPEGLNFNPGPYVITVTDVLVPGVKDMLDVDHKRPWGVNQLRLVNRRQALASLREGPWSRLSARALRGHEIWVNSCASCHLGPGNQVGGNKANRPFGIIEAHARHNADYFARYVRTPQEAFPGATMTAHPHYSDDQIAEIIAYVTAERR